MLILSMHFHTDLGYKLQERHDLREVEILESTLDSWCLTVILIARSAIFVRNGSRAFA